VTATGVSFPAKQSGTVQFGTTKVGTFKSTNQGKFSVGFKVPASASGAVTVTASSAAASATTTFTVQSSTSSATTSTSTTAPPTTTTTVPPTTSTTTPPSSTGFVGRSGRQLTMNGAPYRFTGVNGPDLTTDYTINYGCGETNSQADVDSFFASLRPNSMVRVWAFQQIAWNKNTNKADFAVIDRVVNSAAAHGQKVILVLSHQWGGGCGEFFKTESWFSGGWKQALNDGTSVGAQTAPLSFEDWVKKIVPRYAANPAVGMWEPVNEPYPTVSNGGACSSTAAASLKSFFDTAGVLIHSLDSNHLVSSGLQGSGQCGTAGAEYQTLHQSAGIDVASVHDYYAGTDAMGGDQWNGIQVRINQAAAVNKPIFVGEVGINASASGGSLPTFSQRRDQFKAKMDAQIGAGIAGYMPWTWHKTQSTTEYYISFNDPTLQLLHDYAL
jgi:mannan endo-1,4-beta-mannosidase